MKNNTRYVTQIENDIRRIVKTLLSKNAHIEIDQDNDTTVIIGTYESRRNVYIVKDKKISTIYGVLFSKKYKK